MKTIRYELKVQNEQGTHAVSIYVNAATLNDGFAIAAARALEVAAGREIVSLTFWQVTS